MSKIRINDSYDGIDLDLDIDDKDISLDMSDSLSDLEPEELDKQLKRGDSKLVEFETFLMAKDYFTRVKEMNDSIPTHWKLSVYGNLIQMNLMKWWHLEMVESPSNVISVDEITSDKRTYLKYKAYGAANRKKIPFGVGRTLKLDRAQFKSDQFVFIDKPSKHQVMEFFVKPDSAHSWLQGWFSIMQGKLKSIGFNSEKLTWEHKKVTGDIDTNDYYFEKYDFIYEFPFGKEVIAVVNNRIDHDFQTEDDKMMVDSLRYNDNSGDNPYFPYIIRASIDVEKIVLAVLWERFEKKKFENIVNRSIVLSPMLAPIKAVILPDDSTSDDCIEEAKMMHKRVSEKLNISFEVDNSIDSRINHYRELGVPYFIFINESYLKKGKVNLFDSFNEGWLNLDENELYEYINKNSI